MIHDENFKTIYPPPATEKLNNQVGLIIHKKEIKKNKIYFTGSTINQGPIQLIYLQVPYSKHNNSIQVQDSLICKATCIPIKNLNSRFFKTFDQYLYSKHIQFKAFSKDSVCKYSENNSFNAKRISSQLSGFCTKALEFKSQNHQALSVIKAIMLGDKSQLNTSVKTLFQESGTAHIMAVSGLHMGILFCLLNFILSRLFKKNKRIQGTLKSLLIIFFLWIFALIVGLSPSAVRAAIMISVFLLASPLKRKNNSINTLFFCAFCMQFNEPCLIRDVGFQLSVVAVLSILLFQNLINRLIILRSSIANYIWTIISLSLSVQILIAPLSLYYFQTFPGSFICSNLLWTPISFTTMGLGVASITVYPLYPDLSALINRMNEYLILFGINGLETIQQYSLSTLSGIWITAMDCCIFYGIIFLILLCFQYKSAYLWLISLLLFIVLEIKISYQTVLNFTKPSLSIFYEGGKVQTEFIFRGKCLTTIANSYELIKWRDFRSVQQTIPINQEDMNNFLLSIGIELCYAYHSPKFFKLGDYEKFSSMTFKTFDAFQTKKLNRDNEFKHFINKFRSKNRLIESKFLNNNIVVYE